MLAIVFGLLWSAASIWAIIRWWPDFLVMLRGLGPVLCLGGGLLAIIAGITSIMDELRSKKEQEKQSSN